MSRRERVDPLGSRRHRSRRRRCSPRPAGSDRPSSRRRSPSSTSPLLLAPTRRRPCRPRGPTDRPSFGQTPVAPVDELPPIRYCAMTVVPASAAASAPFWVSRCWAITLPPSMTMPTPMIRARRPRRRSPGLGRARRRPAMVWHRTRFSSTVREWGGGGFVQARSTGSWSSTTRHRPDQLADDGRQGLVGPGDLDDRDAADRRPGCTPPRVGQSRYLMSTSAGLMLSTMPD